MINEPSVFEPLKVYCMRTSELLELRLLTTEQINFPF